jgi:tetratricopeptide (TPR) repeat protein
MGRAQYDQGTFKAALRSLKMATDLDPRSARAWYQLGLVNLELKQLPVAKQALETAVKSDAQLSEGYYYLGRVRAAAGDGNANEAYQKYLEVAPKGPYADEVRQLLKGGPAAAPPPKPTSSPPRTRRRGR